MAVRRHVASCIVAGHWGTLCPLHSAPATPWLFTPWPGAHSSPLQKMPIWGPSGRGDSRPMAWGHVPTKPKTGPSSQRQQGDRWRGTCTSHLLPQSAGTGIEPEAADPKEEKNTNSDASPTTKPLRLPQASPWGSDSVTV